MKAKGFAQGEARGRWGRVTKLFAAVGVFSVAFGGFSFIAADAAAEDDGVQVALTDVLGADTLSDALQARQAEVETAEVAAPVAEPEPVAPVVEPEPAEAVVVEAAAPVEPVVEPAPIQTHWNINVNCAGGQNEIDGCVGATNFLPAMEVLGVPYYAQHDYLGGNAWWNIEIGHTVTAEGLTYVATDIRIIATGGSSDQVVDMPADAFLQTCLDDGVHSRVIALTLIG